MRCLRTTEHKHISTQKNKVTIDNLCIWSLLVFICHKKPKQSHSEPNIEVSYTRRTGNDEHHNFILSIAMYSLLRINNAPVWKRFAKTRSNLLKRKAKTISGIWIWLQNNVAAHYLCVHAFVSKLKNTHSCCNIVIKLQAL